MEKKYVVLEHLQLPNRGGRFWSTNKGVGKNCHSHKGELWYKEILFTDDADEAMRISQQHNVGAYPTSDELYEYYRNNRSIDSGL